MALPRRVQVRLVDGAGLGGRRLELPAEHEREEVLLRRQEQEVVLNELEKSTQISFYLHNRFEFISNRLKVVSLVTM